MRRAQQVMVCLRSTLAQYGFGSLLFSVCFAFIRARTSQVCAPALAGSLQEMNVLNRSGPISPPAAMH